MNCYVCLVETGCESRPALAICQRCGAGMCQAHLVESVVTPVVGLAGDTRSLLICCRCAPSPPHPATRAAPRKRGEEQDGQDRTAGWHWWRRLRRRRSSTLPRSEEAVAAVERFLNNPRNQEI